MVVSGYAAKYNTRSQDLGGFVETLAPGAFARAIREAHDVRAVINHDANLILGRTAAGTLTLEDDNTGLRYEVVLPDTSYARDLAESMRRGDINQSSFSFRVLDQDWSHDTDERALRTITDVYLYDVSPVTYPAYLDTTSGVSESSRRAYRAAMDARSPAPLVLDRTREHAYAQTTLSLSIEVLNIR